MGPVASVLPDGRRLHLRHGPIDLIVDADGSDDARTAAFNAAISRFDTVLEELVQELPLLRTPLKPDAPVPTGHVARQMDRATRPHAARFVTRMAAVAGAVADTILQEMRRAAPLSRAYVNNGGDIAVYLARGTEFSLAMRDHSGVNLGRVLIRDDQGVGGVATSGRHGRSLSMGIADSVTVLARNAAEADAAATLIANVVDLPGHPSVRRCPARDLDPDSDLGERPVVTGCGPLTRSESAHALDTGMTVAKNMRNEGKIIAAALFLAGEARTAGDTFELTQWSLADA